MRARMYVCVNKYIYGQVYVYVCTHMWVCVGVYVYICMYACTFVCNAMNRKEGCHEVP